jgi:transposase
MIFIGIDIAKSNHFASAVNSDGEVLVNPFKFTNDDIGFKLFLETFKNFDLSNCLVGLESTGIYGDNLTTFLFEKGFKIGRINPIQTDSLRSSNIRKTKNDKIDTFLITQCLMLGHYTLITEKDIELIKLKTLCRFKFDVKKSQSKAKVQLVTCLDIAFPELARFFNGNLHIKSSYALLSKYPTAKIIANTRIDALNNLLYSASKGHFRMDKAIALKTLAKSSVAMDNPAIGMQIKMLIEQIQMLQKQIDLLDISINNIMEQLNSPISSIPGVGIWLGAIIISEIGDISRFSSATKLLAFAGLDPSVRQSGNFNATNTKISKRGSKHLRYAINRAAQLIIWNDDTFYQYYTTKLAQGKSYLNAIGHVSHKLTRVIFKLLTTNTTFKV